MEYPTILVKYCTEREQTRNYTHQPARHQHPSRWLAGIVTCLISFSLPALADDLCTGALNPYTVQGDGDSSPLEGQRVAVGGTVTYADRRDDGVGGFFIQGPTDHNPDTSEALFIYAPDHRTEPGQQVVVQGEVKEYYGLTELTSVTGVTQCGTAPVPEPATLGEPDEPMENMRVRIPPTRIIDNFRLLDTGELLVSDGEHRWTLENGTNARRLDAIPWGLPQDPTRVANGLSLPAITGILTWRWERWVILPDEAPQTTDTPDRTLPRPADETLRLTTFNAENLFNGDQGDFAGSRGARSEAEWHQQRRKITSALIAMQSDLFMLQEIEHDQDQADPVMSDLHQSLNDASDHRFDYVAPVVEPGDDAITNAFIYNTERLTPEGELIRIETTPRPALVQTFRDEISGEVFHAINVHMKSRGRGCTRICASDREAELAEILDWLSTQDLEAPWLLAGDFNTLSHEPLWAPLVDAHWQRAEVSEPTYWFRGEPQQIDHIWHRNLPDNLTAHVQTGHAELPPMPFQHPLYDPDSPWGASDHNAVILDIGW